MSGGVERSALDARGRRADEAFRATEHLVGGASRESEQEDSLGFGALVDEMRDAIDERARLPSPGAGDDEERSLGMRCCRELFRVQLGAKVPGWGGDNSLSGGIEQRLGHAREYRFGGRSGEGLLRAIRPRVFIALRDARARAVVAFSRSAVGDW